MSDDNLFTEINQTCAACPSQWEVTVFGRLRCYVRYRCGSLSVGFGESIDEAVQDTKHIAILGGGFDGEKAWEEVEPHVRGEIVRRLREFSIQGEPSNGRDKSETPETLNRSAEEYRLSGAGRGDDEQGDDYE